VSGRAQEAVLKVEQANARGSCPLGKPDEIASVIIAQAQNIRFTRKMRKGCSPSRVIGVVLGLVRGGARQRWQIPINEEIRFDLIDGGLIALQSEIAAHQKGQPALGCLVVKRGEKIDRSLVERGFTLTFACLP